MAAVGIHASHEQIPPSRLLRCDRARPRTAGFDARHVLGPLRAVERAPGRVRVRVVVARRRAARDRRCRSASSTRPGQRYHPAIIAQAAATLCEMFPGRLWVALGTGEASNEHITGEPLAGASDVRNARLRECVDVMRALFAGEEVTHDGLVARRPRAAVDAAGRAAAAAVRGGERRDRALGRRVGGRAGTVNAAASSSCARMLDAFRETAARASRSPAGARVVGADRGGGAARSRTTSGARNVFDAAAVLGPRHAPRQFDVAAQHVRPEDVRVGGARSPPTWRSTSRGCRSSRRSASTTSALHHVGQEQRRVHRRVRRARPAASCDERQGDQRPVVEERGRLLPRRRDVPRLRRRRLRRPRRA